MSSECSVIRYLRCILEIRMLAINWSIFNPTVAWRSAVSTMATQLTRIYAKHKINIFKKLMVTTTDWAKFSDTTLHFAGKNKAFIDIKLRPGVEIRHRTHCGQTWRHPQNRKYITYRNAAREGPSHGHRGYSGYPNIRWGSVHRFHRYARGKIHTQTDWSQYSASLLGRSNEMHRIILRIFLHVKTT